MDNDLRAIRDALGLDQHELATRLGVSQPLISQIEKGNRSITRRMKLQLETLLDGKPLAEVAPIVARFRVERLADDLFAMLKGMTQGRAEMSEVLGLLNSRFAELT